MDNLQRCLNILDAMGKGMRYWGRHIDEFSQCYCSLSHAKRCKLREITPKQDKDALMRQMVGLTNREFLNASWEEKKRIILLSFVAISFENFELDYRDSLMDVRQFFKDTDTHEELRLEIWNKVKHLMPTESLRYLGRYFNHTS